MTKQTNTLSTGDPQGLGTFELIEPRGLFGIEKIPGVHPRITKTNCLFCNKEVVFLKNKNGKDIRVDAIFKDFIVTDEDFKFNPNKHHQHKCNEVDFMVKTMKMEPDAAAEIIAKKNNDKAANKAMQEVNELLEGEDLDE